MPSNTKSKVYRLQLVQYWIDWLATGFATGKWDSLFLGRGFDFQGLAPFRDDPDMVRINWPATLVSDEVQVSQFAEERNINVYFLADLGPTMAFGSQVTKQDRLALIAAIFAYSAQRLKDSFYYLAFTDKVENGFPQVRSKNYPLLLAETIADFNIGDKRGGLPSAVLRVSTNKSLVVIVSDFLGDSEALIRSLTLLSPRHEVLPLVLWDKREVSLPERGWGLYPFRDLETAELSYVLLNDKNRQKFAANYQLRRQGLEMLFSRFNLQPHFLIGDGDDDIEALMKAFLSHRNTV